MSGAIGQIAIEFIVSFEPVVRRSLERDQFLFFPRVLLCGDGCIRQPLFESRDRGLQGILVSLLFRGWKLQKRLGISRPPVQPLFRDIVEEREEAIEIAL